MAPFITKPAFKFHPSFSRLHARLVNVHSKVHKLPGTMLHKIRPIVHKRLNARQLPAPISFYHPDNMDPGPGINPASLASQRHRLDPTPLNRLSVWAYLALAFVILAVVTVISYMIYSCYHSAGLRARMKPAMSVGVGGASTGEVKGGWQTLEDPAGDSNGGVVEEAEGKLTKDRDVGEKVDDYKDEDKKNGIIDPWCERRGSGLKGLGIQLHKSSNSQYDLGTSHPNESQVSIIHGSPHSTCSGRSLGSTSDHEHEQDLESSEGSDCPSMSAQPLSHTTERSATYIPFNLPLPLPVPLPSPVTPSPVHHRQQVKPKRTRLRALTQILSHNLTQNQNGREMYFELQPMIKAEKGIGQSKGFKSDEILDESSPPSPSPLSSRSKFSPVQFAFFAPYNSASNSTSNNAAFTSNSWDNNSLSCSPTTFPTTPISPLTPITPMTPVTPIKPGPAAAATAELQFDSNNIQFVETPARNADTSPGALGVCASPPEIQGALEAVSVNSLTRAETLWNDPKLSPVQGAFGVASSLDGEKTRPVSPTEMVLAKTRAAAPSKLKSPTASIWQGTFDSSPTRSFSDHVLAPILATPDQVHHGRTNLRLGYLRRGTSLSSPPSPSPSSCSSYSSPNSVSSSPSIATARFILDRGELKRDNLRNRDSRAGQRGREKENMKPLSPIPRPVFLPHHSQASKFQDQTEQSF